MCDWDCCRTCLNTQNLFPIFPNPEHCDKFTEVILTTTGFKVEPNDTLPQAMCIACIGFINESNKFRRKCETAQTHLLNKIINKDFFDTKIEMPVLKVESSSTAIDISCFNDADNDFKDYDDNIPLDSLQLENNIDFIENNASGCKKDEIESQIESTGETINNKRKKIQNRNTTKDRRPRTKKEMAHNKERGERARENIECEYCHKILTSKLSLRNHYKIHTGFDVVCEHCGKKFITRRLLLMHCRAKHGYEKTDKCSYCDYRASNAEQVKIHERLHTGEKPYVCGECKAGFHRKSSYLQHIAIHLPEKNVQCDQCPARFKSVTLMRIHKNRHRAPQYSYRCRVCENNFARRRNVARHLQRVHGLPPEPAHIGRLKIV